MGFIQEDQIKIQAKIAELTKQFGGNWSPVDGFTALTNVQFITEGLIFNPTVGVPIKAFINQDTGEIKTFSAQLFIKT
jgi:hypothetical protein